MLARVSGGTMRIGFGLSLAMLFLLSVAVQPARPQGKDAVERQLDALFLEVTTANDPGCAVLVKHGGLKVLEKGYGVRELRTPTKIDPHTDFRLASFSKQFTAMAVMLLIRDGKLRYEETLTEIFPEFPAYGQSITIRHLLNHTSGLPDYEELMEKEEKAKGPIWSSEHQIQDDEVLALLEKTSVGKFPPGSSWAYSNSGYVVLGIIVRKASGMPYRDFLQKRIFFPAGMNHSLVYQKGINEIPNRAFGHSRQDGKFVETDQSSTSATLGDGGVYSNLEDLSRWDDALENHLLLGEKEMAPALEPVKLADGSEAHWPKEAGEDNATPGKPVSYGFGWFLDSWEGHPRMYHTGSTRGFRTVIERFTRDGLTTVVLCNRLDLEPQALAEKSAGLLLRTQTQ